MKRLIVVSGMLLVTVLMLGGLWGCTAGEEPGASPGGGGISAPSLTEFLEADTKTGRYETHTDWANGDTYDQTGDFWVDGRLFRYDIYDTSGTLVRSVISTDGVTAYVARHDEKMCEPSVASVDYYLMRYSMPTGGGSEDGTDEETGATRVVYSVQKTDDMAGAANAWYSEDVTYLVKDDQVIGVITRGAIPDEDGSVGELDVNRELWTDVRTGDPIAPGTFELPYPIETAK